MKELEVQPITFGAKLRGCLDFWVGNGWEVYKKPDLYDTVVNEWFKRENLAERVANVVEDNTSIGGNILELGAGTGVLTLNLVRRGFNVTAVDVEPRALDALQNKAGENFRDAITTRKFDFNHSRWPLSPNNYDTAVILRANRYITDLPQFLASTYDVLKLGGKIVLPVFWLDFLPWKLNSNIGLKQPTSSKALREELANVGFAIDEKASGKFEEDHSHQQENIPFFYNHFFLIARKP